MLDLENVGRWLEGRQGYAGKDGQAMTPAAVTVAQSASLSDNFPATDIVLACQPD